MMKEFLCCLINIPSEWWMKHRFVDELFSQVFGKFIIRIRIQQFIIQILMDHKPMADTLLSPRYSIVENPSLYWGVAGNGTKQINSHHAKHQEVKGSLRTEVDSKLEEIGNDAYIMGNKQSMRDESMRRNRAHIFSNQITELKAQIGSLKKEIKTLKQDHEHELDLKTTKYKQSLLKISQFLSSNQIQRIKLYLTNQLNQLNNQIQEPKLQSVMYSQFPFLNSFLSQSLTVISEINISVGDVPKLPQLKKMQKERDICSNKLNWYLSNSPFEDNDTQRRSKVVRYLLNFSKTHSGRDIVSLLMKLLEQYERYHHIKSQISQIIQLNTMSRFCDVQTL